MMNAASLYTTQVNKCKASKRSLSADPFAHASNAMHEQSDLTWSFIDSILMSTIRKILSLFVQSKHDDDGVKGGGISKEARLQNTRTHHTAPPFHQAQSRLLSRSRASRADPDGLRKLAVGLEMLRHKKLPRETSQTSMRESFLPRRQDVFVPNMKSPLAK
ncbi:hypothetical protein O0I10_008944 [Lichtheimia ornata]|uniref:Uncharacterized protein n=1 Tax=Lichtheimia ornata TaxID=688661 RepID=A0AAD7UY63_9FUNG|nr:uncharacterized protein O0I10_008944 [Lichtheimia ornata]KAJ8655450.1 hypothetical protein O0I10_008944 [Lichtheimia ornata]